MAMSWLMMVEFEPPLVACVVSNADISLTEASLRKQIAVKSDRL